MDGPLCRLSWSGPVRSESGLANQEFGVLQRIDVIRDHRNIHVIAQGLAQPQDQGCLAGANRAADTDPYRTSSAIVVFLSLRMSYQEHLVVTGFLELGQTPRSAPTSWADTWVCPHAGAMAGTRPATRGLSS